MTLGQTHCASCVSLREYELAQTGEAARVARVSLLPLKVLAKLANSRTGSERWRSAGEAGVTMVPPASPASQECQTPFGSQPWEDTVRSNTARATLARAGRAYPVDASTAGFCCSDKGLPPFPLDNPLEAQRVAPAMAISIGLFGQRRFSLTNPACDASVRPLGGNRHKSNGLSASSRDAATATPYRANRLHAGTVPAVQSGLTRQQSSPKKRKGVAP